MVCRHVRHGFLQTSENRANAPTGTEDRRKWISVFVAVSTSSSPSASLVFTASCLSLLTSAVNTTHNVFGQRGTLRRVSLRASFGNTRKLSETERFEKDIRTRQKNPFFLFFPRANGFPFWLRLFINELKRHESNVFMSQLMETISGSEFPPGENGKMLWLEHFQRLLVKISPASL